MATADPVTAYARDVVADKVVAGRLVRQACQRHLNDLEQAGAKGIVWRLDQAQKAIDFFAEVLYLPENTDAGEEAGEMDLRTTAPQSFVLQPWQQFIVGSVMGWYTVTGFRRFREAYIETAKGSGKTPLGAGIMLYLLVADGERGAQVFLAAVTREQAGYAWRDVLAMVDASPELRELFKDGRYANELKVPEDGSFLKPVSSEKRGLDGKRVHGALVDELHEHATPIVVNKMRAGTKGRRNALIVKTTNSGFDRSSVCWSNHEHSRKVLEGSVQNDAWFAFICGLDPCDECAKKGRWFPSEDCPNCDDWKTEGPHWLKANPNLGVSLPWQYVRERVEQAKAKPDDVSDVLRFNFCVWTQAITRAIDMSRWAICPELPTQAELDAAQCFGCLDLGETDDFSAWGLLWVLKDGRVATKLHYWVPDVALQRHPNRDYEIFTRAGVLTVTDGDDTDYEKVRARIIEDCRENGVITVFYDTRSAKETAQILKGQGIDIAPITQGFPMHEAIQRFLGMVVDGTFCHEHELDPVLTWMASNLTLLENSKKEKRIAKERAPEKIDGIAAVIIGIEGAIVRRAREPEMTYQIIKLGGR